MDWLTFIAAIFKAVAWPLTTFAIFAFLRRPLLGLIPLLRKLKWKELELEFEQKIVELKTEASQALPAATGVSLLKPTTSRLAQLAEISPRSAIIEAWIDVEHAATRALTKRIPETGFAWTAGQLGQLLAANELIDKSKLELYNSLRKLRNQAAHHEEFRIEPRHALDYVNLAEALANYLEPKT